MNFVDTAEEAGTLVDSGLGSMPDIRQMENIGLKKVQNNGMPCKGLASSRLQSSHFL
jgi:hypothetical protein